jgi:hypothetical protein
MKTEPFKTPIVYSNDILVNDNSLGYWNGKKEKLKQKFSAITDEDVCFKVGKEKEMVEMLGYKLSKSMDEMCEIIDTL